MKITQIDVYQITCEYSETYKMSRGQAISSLISTIIKISTDEGCRDLEKFVLLVQLIWTLLRGGTEWH